MTLKIRGADQITGQNCDELKRRTVINDNNRGAVGSAIGGVLTICSRQIVDEAPVIGVATKIHGGGGADGSRRQAARAHAPTARFSSRIRTYRLIYYCAIFNRCDQINICMFFHKISDPSPNTTSDVKTLSRVLFLIVIVNQLDK